MLISWQDCRMPVVGVRTPRAPLCSLSFLDLLRDEVVTHPTYSQCLQPGLPTLPLVRDQIEPPPEPL